MHLDPFAVPPFCTTVSYVAREINDQVVSVLRRRFLWVGCVEKPLRALDELMACAVYTRQNISQEWPDAFVGASLRFFVER